MRLYEGGRRVGKSVGLKGFLIDFHFNCDYDKASRKVAYILNGFENEYELECRQTVEYFIV